MNYESYFPRGIAEGKAFCNRKTERSRLINNIQTGQHTLLMSPRRYGKTSLALYATNEAAVPFGDTDFFVALDAKKIEQGMLIGIKKIMANIGTPIEQVLDFLRHYFKSKHSEWMIGTHGINVALIPSSNNDSANNILEALQALEELLQKKSKRAVLFCDEVQEISEIAGGSAIEGAIRHVAQKTKYLSLIFSGSKSHLLTKMFYCKTRPLYKLCDRIVLSRIDESEYVKHINEFAVQKWGKNLDSETLSAIFDFTELHPYYVNNLCLRIWQSDIKNSPNSRDVLNCWRGIVKEEWSETIKEFSNLSLGQRKIMQIIALGKTTELTSKAVLRDLDLSSAASVEALRVLEQKDYIEKLENGEYRIIDPLIKATLFFYYSNLN